jgi:hypothetical protein
MAHEKGRIAVKGFHFSCGDSTRGPVGLAGKLRAKTKRQALLKIRRALRQAVGPCGELKIHVPERSVEYLNLYINPERITAIDMDGDS